VSGAGAVLVKVKRIASSGPPGQSAPIGDRSGASSGGTITDTAPVGWERPPYSPRDPSSAEIAAAR
jgi:hypothetical protein